MSKQKMDFSKVLAMLAQPKKALPPLKNVRREIINVPYIRNSGVSDVRKIGVFIPDEGTVPMPLIYIPHYEMTEDAAELRDYLSEGWAVASPTEMPPHNANGELCTDDLVFNNAALYTLRRMALFDRQRICLVGGSAGGYMALMLMGQNLGLCATVANGPVANLYFNFCYHWVRCQEMNLKAMASSPDVPGTTAVEKLAALVSVPVPFIAALYNEFSPANNAFPDQTDAARFEALCGTGIAHRFSNPLMVNHSSSDVLVPVDQITKKFTYKTPGDSLPADFDLRLQPDFPGKMKYSLEECLDPAKTRTMRFEVPEIVGESDLPYDPEKMFNLNIFDDGPVEGYGSHSSRMDTGRRRDIPYLRDMLRRTAAKTVDMTPGMLRFLLDQYCGKSIALPAHKVDGDPLYGSLTAYREKVCFELSEWAEIHGRDALVPIFESVWRAEQDEAERIRLKNTMGELMQKI